MVFTGFFNHLSVFELVVITGFFCAVFLKSQTPSKEENPDIFLQCVFPQSLLPHMMMVMMVMQKGNDSLPLQLKGRQEI